MRILQIDESGLRKLIGMAAAEGWNPGIHDASTFFAVDPDGFVGIHVNDALIGGGAIVRHSDTFGFMGLFLMAPESRGQGMGRKLWYARRDRLRERLAPDAAIGMDGVSAMVDFYREGGFVPQYISSRFQVRGVHGDREADAHVVPLIEAEAGDLEEIDRRAFPSERRAYLSAWLRQPEAYAFGYRESNGRVSGYAVMRPCEEGWKIGPLFAETPEVAVALIDRLLPLAKGALVSIDVPSKNPDAERLCRSLGMESAFQCTRMYFGPPPSYDASLIFGLTSFELG